MAGNSNKGFARQRDKNEKEIVDALHSVGASVTRLNEKGVPDLLVGFIRPIVSVESNLLGITKLMEVKRPLGPKGGGSHSTLTDDQQTWWNEWKGDRPVVVRTIEDALRALGLRIDDGALGIWTYCEDFKCDGRTLSCEQAHTHKIGTYPRGQR